MDVSIIIISYCTRELALNCLRSIYSQTRDLQFEVIVLDNASTDGSAEAIAAQFPQVSLIRLEKNIGFARANNLAAQEAKGRFLLLLNPDTFVLDQAINKLHHFAMAHHGQGIFGGRTLFPDGSLNPSSCWRRPTLWSLFCVSTGLTQLFPHSRLFAPESYGPWQRDSIRQVDIVTGCFLMIEKTLWDHLHGFDPAFFMYGEETDLCLRAAHTGYHCWICPDAQIIHYGGASEKVRAEKMIRLFCAKQQIFRKHWGAIAQYLGMRALDLWAFTRLVIFGVVKRLSPQWDNSYHTWIAVWRHRAAWHVNPNALLPKTSK